MMALFKHKLNRKIIRVAAACFCLETLLMLTALMAENDSILSFGIAFLILYVPLTLIILFVLFINTISNLKDIHEHVMTVIIVLMNVPVGLLYIYFLNPIL